MFGIAENNYKLDWKNPQTIEELDELMDDASQPIIIFKHSTRCPVSRMALKMFENDYNLENVRLIFVEVVQQRPLSNHIAEKWNIQHESPQTLIQKTNGERISFSHNQINVAKIAEFLQQ